MLSDFRDVKSIPQYLRGPPFRGPPIQGPPPSLWNYTISQVHQEFPSKIHPGPRKHKGISKVHKGPPPSLWNTNISQVHQEFPSYPRSTLAQGNHRGVFQGPPRSTTISVGYNHFTGSPRISFQGPPWPKEIIKVYPRSTKVHHHPCGIQTFHRLTKKSFLSKIHPGPRKP